MKTLIGLPLLLTLSQAFAGPRENALALRRAIQGTAPKALVAEEVRLPVSRGFDQADSSLCWVHSFLNAVESMRLAQDPEERVEFSRSYFQYTTLEDRFLRAIRTNEEFLSERGTPQDALELAQNRGLVVFGDYSPTLVPGINYRYREFEDRIDRGADGAGKEAELAAVLADIFPALPDVTNFLGRSLSPVALAQEVLGSRPWAVYAPTRPGRREGWGPHPDPDSRGGKRAYYTSPTVIAGKIRQALLDKRAVTYGGNGHSILIYGADYNRQGQATLYYIKDSYPDFFYTATPRQLFNSMLEVTFPE